jgi:hypothetical protein
VRTMWRVRTAQVAAVVLGVVALGLGVASVVLDHLTHQSGTGGPAADAFITAAAVVPAAGVGTLLAARRPRNPIGWIVLAILIVDISPARQYLTLDYRMQHGTLPFGGVAVVLEECWPMFLVLITLLLWLFPDGTLPHGRWSRFAAIGVVGLFVAGLMASSRGVLVAVGGDFRIQADGNLATKPPVAFGALDGVVIIGSVVGWAAWLAVQIPSYRHAGGERRQQLKWLFSGAAIFVAALIIGIFIAPIVVGEAPGWDSQWAVGAVTTLGAAVLPVCMGVAVLKYRLYEIDRIISRVLSYTVITVLLGGLFAGLVLLATRVLPIKSSVAVAAATLVIAALFNPLRRRVQHAVDRRFNRARYDAESLIAAFTGRLRQTVDLDVLRGDLVGVIDAAFQPVHVSVWLPATEPQTVLPAPAPAGGE